MTPTSERKRQMTTANENPSLTSAKWDMYKTAWCLIHGQFVSIKAVRRDSHGAVHHITVQAADGEPYAVHPNHLSRPCL
jgi:hypothetical protein